MKIIFATHNPNKKKEIDQLFEHIDIIGLSDLNFNEEIPETGETLEENAAIKAHTIFQKFNTNCFADDTGLEVNALNGAPGVYSARYAGLPSNAQKNINKLLEALKNKKDRSAQFRTVIHLILNEKTHVFEGVCKGRIATNLCGSDGFGYDPVFIPDGYNITFAEMTLEEKNKISHRGLAIQKLITFLNNNV